MTMTHHGLPLRVVSSCLSVLLVWGQAGQEASHSATSPQDRLDAMGAYRLDNRLQCQNLCCRRLLCTSFRYRGGGGDGHNCVLHSSHGEGEKTTWPTLPAWSEETLSPPGTPSDSDGCWARPCSAQDLCVPSRGSEPGYHCLPMPADCGSPTPVGNATHVYSGTGQGQRSTVQCDAGYVASPYQVSVETECQVSSHWTSFRGECLQAVYDSDEVPAEFQLPWQLFDGWEACFQGVFSTHSRMFFNFKTGPGPDTDWPMHIDFRNSYMNDRDLVLVSSRFNNLFSPDLRFRDPPMPLNLNDRFSLAFRLNSTFLRLNLNNEQIYEIPLDSLPLNNSRVIGVDQCNLMYVNLVSGCSLIS